jgi:hypothetical protein
MWPVTSYADPTFQLNATETRYLPPAMYGTWSITATVLHTTAPRWLYAPASSELWTLGREGGFVTLKNLVTKAIATVQVDHAEGDTAIFHHIAHVPSRKLRVIETPTITVKGDRLTGINRQVVIFERKNKPPVSYIMEISLTGSRLSGAPVTFGNLGMPPPSFEIEPLRVQDP